MAVEMMNINESSLRKVALLVASLDRETADRLLDQFSEDGAQAVRNAVLALSTIDGAEQREVIRDFLAADGRELNLRFPSALLPHGALPNTAAGMRAAAHVDADTPSKVAGKPLDRASERLIAECLCGEMPQAIAVALAQLSTQRASEVVAHLPATLQAQVLERLVEFDPANALDLPDIRDEFYHWLNEQIERSLHRAELAARLAAILEATHSGTRQRILHNVSNSDARLAKELQHQLAAISCSPD